ncbi:MAG: cell division protein SepF [Oscillospiraceae bacterium]|nr:cell division protein SepF [Oscillospiraceae bacterium]
MKAFDKIRDFFAPEEDDSYETEPVRETREVQRRETREPVRESYRDSYREPEEPVAREREPREVREPRESLRESYTRPEPSTSYQAKRDNKVVNIQATAQLQVVLVKPEVFTDAKQIADHLISKKTVVLNLETASAENKRRIIDFLVGVAYANGGSLKPVANLTYIITPYNVGFIGEDLVNELETNGVIM